MKSLRQTIPTSWLSAPSAKISHLPRARPYRGNPDTLIPRAAVLASSTSASSERSPRFRRTSRPRLRVRNRTRGFRSVWSAGTCHGFGFLCPGQDAGPQEVLRRPSSMPNAREKGKRRRAAALHRGIATAVTYVCYQRRRILCVRACRAGENAAQLARRCEQDAGQREAIACWPNCIRSCSWALKRYRSTSKSRFEYYAVVGKLSLEGCR